MFDDQPVSRPERGRGGLREEQRRAQVGTDQVVELRQGDRADGRR